MFSLIIVIISIALVALLALATIYYGGTAYSNYKASAEASTLTNQASQLYAASMIYKQSVGTWPANPGVLLNALPDGSTPLNALPVPPQGTLAMNFVREAIAQQAKEWEFVMDGNQVLTFIALKEAVKPETCLQVKLKSEGNDSLLSKTYTEAVADIKATLQTQITAGTIKPEDYGFQRVGDNDWVLNETEKARLAALAVIPNKIDPGKTYQCVDEVFINSEAPANQAYTYFWKAPSGGDTCGAVTAYNTSNAKALGCGTSTATTPPASTCPTGQYDAGGGHCLCNTTNYEPTGAGICLTGGKQGFWVLAVTGAVDQAVVAFAPVVQFSIVNEGFSESCSSGIVPQAGGNPLSGHQGLQDMFDLHVSQANLSTTESGYWIDFTAPGLVQARYCLPALESEVTSPAVWPQSQAGEDRSLIDVLYLDVEGQAGNGVNQYYGDSVRGIFTMDDDGSYVDGYQYSVTITAGGSTYKVGGLFSAAYLMETVLPADVADGKGGRNGTGFFLKIGVGSGSGTGTWTEHSNVPLYWSNYPGGGVPTNSGATATYRAYVADTGSVGVPSPSPLTCSLPWGGTLSDGQAVTAYKTSSVPAGNSCQSQQRVCVGGSLTGSWTNQSCLTAVAATANPAEIPMASLQGAGGVMHHAWWGYYMTPATAVTLPEPMTVTQVKFIQGSRDAKISVANSFLPYDSYPVGGPIRGSGSNDAVEHMVLDSTTVWVSILANPFSAYDEQAQIEVTGTSLSTGLPVVTSAPIAVYTYPLLGDLDDFSISRVHHSQYGSNITVTGKRGGYLPAGSHLAVLPADSEPLSADGSTVMWEGIISTDGSSLARIPVQTSGTATVVAVDGWCDGTTAWPNGAYCGFNWAVNDFVIKPVDCAKIGADDNWGCFAYAVNPAGRATPVGKIEYYYNNCTLGAMGIAHKSGITRHLYPVGNCTATEVRSCFDGTLSGSAEHASCVPSDVSVPATGSGTCGALPMDVTGGLPGDEPRSSNKCNTGSTAPLAPGAPAVYFSITAYDNCVTSPSGVGCWNGVPQPLCSFLSTNVGGRLVDPAFDFSANGYGTDANTPNNPVFWQKANGVPSSLGANFAPLFQYGLAGIGGAAGGVGGLCNSDTTLASKVTCTASAHPVITTNMAKLLTCTYQP